MSNWIRENGKLTVEVLPREGCPMDIEELLPKTQRTFWNPETGDFVSYQRARQLGLNTDQPEPEVYIPGEEHKLYKK